MQNLNLDQQTHVPLRKARISRAHSRHCPTSDYPLRCLSCQGPSESGRTLNNKAISIQQEVTKMDFCSRSNM